jgi:hypothetical protein
VEKNRAGAVITNSITIREYEDSLRNYAGQPDGCGFYWIRTWIETVSHHQKEPRN